MRIETILLVAPLLAVHGLRTGNWAGSTIPLMASGSLIGYYNWVRFGNPLNSGMGNSAAEAFSTPIFKGLAGQFVAPGNGLFVYAPYLGVCLVVSVMLLRHRSLPNGTVWVALLVGAAGYLLIHSAWHSWMGGWSWGPRRMIPLLAPLHLLVALTWWHASRGLKRFLLVLLCFSILINLGGLLGDYDEYYRGTFYVRDVLFDPAASQILNQNLGLLRGSYTVDNFWVQLLGPLPGGVVLAGWLSLSLFCFSRAGTGGQQ